MNEDAQTTSSPYETAVKMHGWRLRQILEEARDVFVHDPSLANLGATIEEISLHTDGDDTFYRLTIGHVDAFVDIDAGILDAAVYEGEEVQGKLAFDIDIVTHLGAELYRLAPYNYQPEFWLDASDENAVKARLRALEEMFSPYNAAGLIAKALTPIQEGA